MTDSTTRRGYEGKRRGQPPGPGGRGRRGRRSGRTGDTAAARGGGCPPVVACDADAERLAQAVDAARFAHGGATVTGDTVNLLSLEETRAWADKTEKEFGRIDGLVHLVGGWRGSASFAETDLSDWDTLHNLLVRTLQHTSLAFEGALKRAGDGRFLLISALGASKPTAGNAAYAASKAAAEAWTLALGDSFRKQGGGESGPAAAAVILVVKALVHDQMRADRPNAKFAGFTDVEDLAKAVADTWNEPAEELNGTRLWLTPNP